MTGMVLLLPVTFVIVVISQMAVAEAVVRIFHDRSYFELFILMAEAQTS